MGNCIPIGQQHRSQLGITMASCSIISKHFAKLAKQLLELPIFSNCYCSTIHY